MFIHTNDGFLFGPRIEILQLVELLSNHVRPINFSLSAE